MHSTQNNSINNRGPESGEASASRLERTYRAEVSNFCLKVLTTLEFILVQMVPSPFRKSSFFMLFLRMNEQILQLNAMFFLIIIWGFLKTAILELALDASPERWLLEAKNEEKRDQH